MPRWNAKLDDGRTVVLESDTQPSEQDVLAAVKEFEATTRTAAAPATKPESTPLLPPGWKPKLDASQMLVDPATGLKRQSGMESGTELTTAIAQNPTEFLGIPFTLAAKFGTGLVRTARDLMAPTTWLPESQKPQEPFTIPLGEGNIAPRAREEALQVGKPIYQPKGTALQPEGNELERLMSRWSTPESLMMLGTGATRIGSTLLLSQLVPGLVGQVKAVAGGQGTEEQKRDRINDLFSLGVLIAGGKAGWEGEANRAQETYEQYKAKGQAKPDYDALVKEAINNARKYGPSPEFRAVFGGIDPEIAGTTPEKVTAFAKGLGMEWKPVAKPTAPDPELATAVKTTAEANAPLTSQAVKQQMTQPLPDTGGIAVPDITGPVETPTVTETTPVVPKSEMPSTPTQTGLRPAIRLVGGKVVVGDAGITHPDIIKRDNLKAEDIDQRGFVNEKGEFLDREQAAAQTGLPTEKEEGRQHSTDLPEAKRKETDASQTRKETAQAGEQAQGVEQGAEGRVRVRGDAQDRVEAKPGEVTPEQRQKLKALGLTDDDISDIVSQKATVSDVVARKLPTQDRGPDHAKALEEARLQAQADIEQILAPPPGTALKPSVEPSVEAPTIKTEPSATKAAEAVPSGGVKEPWQMTKAEWENPPFVDEFKAIASRIAKREGVVTTHDWQSNSGRMVSEETAKEFFALHPELNVEQWNQRRAKFAHKALVRDAVAEGKPVPPEVLADYPDLKPKPLTPDQEYDASLEAFRKASREFAKVQAEYRAKKIGDAEFLAGRKAFDEAMRVSDEAERKFIEAKNKAEAPKPPSKTIAQPVGPLLEVPANWTPQARRAQLLKLIEERTEEDPKTGEVYPKEDQEENVRLMRAKLAEIERGMAGEKQPEKVADTLSSIDPRKLSDEQMAVELQGIERETAPLYARLEALEKEQGDAIYDKRGNYVGEAKEIEAKLKPFVSLKERIDSERARREMEAKNKAAIEARDKRVAAAPVRERRNGWEIVNDGFEYVLRDPNTKEDVYRGKLGRVREVADESKPESATPESATTTEPQPKSETGKATEELQALRNKQTLWNHALDNLNRRNEEIAKAMDVEANQSGTSTQKYQELYASREQGKRRAEKLETLIRSLGGDVGIARMRAEAEAVKGIPQPMGTQKITNKVLKAQKENLLSQLDEAIKEAPESPAGKITISVPGDGEFTLTNSKEQLQKFRTIVDEGDYVGTGKHRVFTGPFPSTVGGPKEPKLPSDKGKTIPKVSDPKPADIPKIVGDFTSDEKERYVLLTSYSDGTQIVATDGRQLIRVVSDKVPGSPDAPVRLSPKGEVTEVEGRYPNFNQVRDPDAQLIYGGMDTGQLLHIIRQAQVFRDTIITDKTKHSSYGVKLFINPDRSIGARMEIMGDSFEHNLQANAIDMGGYNPDYLANSIVAARKLGNERVDVYAHSGESGPIGFVGKNHESIVMPLRMSEGPGGLRESSSKFLNVSGRAEHGKLSEGLGPLTNPDELISRTPDMGAAGKWNVEVAGGEIRVNQGSTVTDSYTHAKSTKWDTVGTMKLADWPSAKGEQAKAMTKLLKNAIIHNNDDRKPIANKLQSALQDAIKEREGYVEEVAKRKSLDKPAPPSPMPPESPKTLDEQLRSLGYKSGDTLSLTLGDRRFFSAYVMEDNGKLLLNKDTGPISKPLSEAHYRQLWEQRKVASPTPMPPEQSIGAIPPMVGPGAKTAGEPKYAAIQQLTDQLQATEAVGAKDRIAAGDKIAEQWAKGRTAFERAQARMRVVGQSLREIAKGVRDVTDIDRVYAQLDWALQQSSARSQEAGKAIREQMKSQTMREAAALWNDTPGTPEEKVALLTQALANLPVGTRPSIRRAISTAANADPDMQGFAQLLEQYYGIRAEDAQHSEIFENALADYYTHIWEKEANMPDQLRAHLTSGKVSTYFRFARKRKIPTFLDGILQGKTPVLDPAKVLPFYNYSLDRSIASRELIGRLSNLNDRADGRPILEAAGSAKIIGSADDPMHSADSVMLIKPRTTFKEMDGYRPVDHPALTKWKWLSKTGERPLTDSEILEKEQEIADADGDEEEIKSIESKWKAVEAGKSVMMQADLKVHPNHFERVANLLDRARLTPSATMRTALAISGNVKGMKLGGLPSAFHAIHTASHAAFHWTNPFRAAMTPIDWSSPETRFAVEKGHLKIAPSPAELNVMAEGMAGTGGLAQNIPLIGPWNAAWQQFQFELLIPRLKMATFENAWKRNVWARDHLPGYLTGLKGLDDEQLAARVGNSVNNAFGELNYMFKGKQGRDPRVQRLLRATFLAPDFGEARLGFAGKAFTKSGFEERIALATMFLALYTASRVANMLSHGDPEWDWRNAFAVKVGNHWWSMRSVVGDLDNALSNFGRFIYARLNPAYSRTITDMLFQRDVAGRKLSLMDILLKRPLEQFIPIQLGALTRDDQRLWESFITSMGIQTRRDTPTMDVHRLISQWKSKSTDPKMKENWEAAQQTIYAPSPYEPLRNALRQDNEPRAAKEYDKLLKTHDASAIANALAPGKPFTGSWNTESKFKASLTPAQRKIYDSAVNEHRELWSKFQSMKSQQPKEGGPEFYAPETNAPARPEAPAQEPPAVPDFDLKNMRQPVSAR